MPMLVSSTADEFTTLIGEFGIQGVSDEASFRQRVTYLYGAASTNDILALYPSASYSSPNDALIALLSDDWYHCTARNQSRVLVKSQSQPVYRALFAHTFDSGPHRADAAGHSEDLFFGFHVFGTQPASPAELALADQMVAYWTQLAAQGNPNPAGQPNVWPAYDAKLDDTFRLDETSTVVDDYHSAKCDYWDYYWQR
jgi:carboxylesterase type B